MAARETISVNEMYKHLGMPYDAVDNDQYWLHLVRIIEELVRRDMLLKEMVEKQLAMLTNLQEQIKELQEWIKSK